jgi:hypothetical protein
VSEESIPLHPDGIHVYAVEGATALMVAGNSMGTNYTTSLLDFYGRSRRVRANDLSETVRLVVLLGQYMQDNDQGRYYAKAKNLARMLRAAYDEALNADLLLMPTLPLKATLLPDAAARSTLRGHSTGRTAGVRERLADFAHAQCRCDPRQTSGTSVRTSFRSRAREGCQCKKTLKPCAKTCSRSSPPARLRCVTQLARMPLTNGS